MANVPPLELTPAQVIVNLGVTGSDLTEAEALGILVAGTVQRSTEAKDQARRFAEDLLIDLAETERHLTALLQNYPKSSWAGSNVAREEAQAFLDRDRLPKPTTLEATGAPESDQETSG